jgi:hypothetical protein
MSLVEMLCRAEKASQYALSKAGRQESVVLATVTDVDDPDGLRRIRVSDPVNPGMQTYWLRRLLSFPGFDPPLPQVGQTVAVHFVDGDPSSGCYTQFVNKATPPFDKESPTDDLRCDVPGNIDLNAGKNQTQYINNDLKIHAGGEIRIENDAGAYLKLDKSGAVILGDAFGNQIVLGGQTAGLGYGSDFIWDVVSGAMNWNLNGHDLNIIDGADIAITAANASLGGNQITTIGSVDSGGYTNETRGW